MRGMLRTATALLFLLANTAVAQKLDSSAIDQVMREMMTIWKIPGASIAVVKDDKVVFLKGYGTRELGGTAQVTPDTLFQIASTSKAFTTTAMAMLVDEKKMKWDDPVRKYIDYFRLADPCADSQVTLRDIVSHRTGLSRHDELWDYTPQTRAEILRSVAFIDLSKPFRSAYQYQNIMFMAAGEAVAAASGMSYEDFVKTRIFDPLGMKNSVIAEADWQSSEHALGYRYDPKKDAVLPQPSSSFDSLGGAGLIKSSARDLSQWLRFQLAGGTIDGKKLLSAEVLNETKTPQTLLRQEGMTREENPETIINTYGLGWRVQDYRGEALISHGGALNSYRTQVALLPKQNAGVAIMINVGRGYAAIAARNSLLDLFIGKSSRDWNAYFTEYEAKLRTEGEADRAKREARRHRDTKPSRGLEAYAGTYSSPAYGMATVAVEKGGLVLTWSRLRAPLTHYHFDTFSAVNEEEDLDEEITFSLGSDGDVKKLTIFGEEFQKKTPLPLAGEGGA